MKITHTHQFPSYEEAKAYLEERGRLEYFGSINFENPYYVYNLHLFSGGMHHVLVYEDGKVEVIE